MHNFCFPPGPSFLERHPLHQYPLTLFGFVGVHSSKKGAWEVSRISLMSFVKAQGHFMVSREAGLDRQAGGTEREGEEEMLR